MDEVFLAFLLAATITIEGVKFMSTNQSSEVSKEKIRNIDKIKEKITFAFAMALFLVMSILSYEGINFIASKLDIQVTNAKMALYMLLSFALVFAFMFLIFCGGKTEKHSKKKYVILFILMLMSSANTSLTIMYFIGSFLVSL